MKNDTERIYKPAQPKTIVYDYLFNYFGKDTFKGKIITGACVQLAISAYKDGKEVKFTKEPSCENIYLCDVYQVSFDREKIFFVEKYLKTENIFRIAFGWDKIEAEVVGYTLDSLDETSWPAEIMKDVPEEFKNLPCSSPNEVSEMDFRKFLSTHIDDYDISDNINAQVPSVSFI